MVYLLCLAVALIMLVASALSTAMIEFRLAGSVLGLVLLVAGIMMFNYAIAPVVLDWLLGQVRLGRRSSLPLLRNIAVPQAAALTDVHTIQLLGRNPDGSSRSFSAYEINPVLNNAERINVFALRCEFTSRSNVCLLSVFLGKPV